MGRGPSIEGRKNAADAQKAKVFTKLVREITLAVKQGGTDPAGNSRLRLAVDRALDANMTRDKVEAAIKRAGGAGADASTEIRYEGYAPGGVALLVDCVTDNPTRTVADVRHAFSKCGGNLGTSGSVAFQFAEVGQLWFETGDDGAAEDRILEVALEAGAEDVQTEVDLATDRVASIVVDLRPVERGHRLNVGDVFQHDRVVVMPVQRDVGDAVRLRNEGYCCVGRLGRAE